MKHAQTSFFVDTGKLNKQRLVILKVIDKQLVSKKDRDLLRGMDNLLWELLDAFKKEAAVCLVKSKGGL